MKKVTTASALILIWLMPMGPLAADDSIANLRESGKAFAAVAESVSPSVASIRVHRSGRGHGALPIAL